jgi:hypothetical protein
MLFNVLIVESGEWRVESGKLKVESLYYCKNK